MVRKARKTLKGLRSFARKAWKGAKLVETLWDAVDRFTTSVRRDEQDRIFGMFKALARKRGDLKWERELDKTLKAMRKETR